MKEVIPTNIRRLFWDVDKGKLDIITDQKSIVERILNYGVLSDWKWLLVTYGKGVVEDVVSNSINQNRSNIREQSRRLFTLLVK